MQVPDIIKQILSAAGIQSRWELRGNYTEWHHCVQFRETNFQFISRLTEHEGIFYYFEHSNNKHTIVFADSLSALHTCSEQESANYAPELGAEGKDYVSAWGGTHALRSGSFKHYDFHFERSANVYTFETTTVDEIAGNGRYKISEVPGKFTHQFNKIDSGTGSSAEGDKLARIRMEEIETHNPMFRATSYCRGFSAGQRFQLEGGPIGEYVITAIEHMGMQHPPYLSGMEASMLYSNTFTCVPFGSKFRPETTTEKPVVQGPQTAIVTDRPDKYGRVRVKYHWGDSLDRPGSESYRNGPVPAGAVFIPRPVMR